MSTSNFILLLFLINSSFSIPISKLIHKNSAIDYVAEASYIEPVCGTFKNISCAVCTLFVDGLSSIVQQQSKEDDIVDFVAKFCAALKIEDENVCTSIAKQYKDEVITVLTNTILTPVDICGIISGQNCGTPYDPNVMWNVTLTNTTKPPIVPPVPPKPDAPILRILHLTDIHIDYDYIVGANADCGEPICCREGNGMAPSDKPRAGMWGESVFQCDIPFRTADNLFKHLATIQDQFDYVIFTGDIPPHNIWNQSRADQIRALQKYSTLFQTYLPNKIVYNAVGNHESSPADSFPPDFITGKNSEDWFYGALAESWSTWLPEDTLPDILRGGFYTVVIKPGFRLVSLNTVFCSHINFWLLINSSDPNGQLQWLVDVLQYAEDHNEKVHIIGHINPGDSYCLKAWSWNYYKIINRYENTIVGQFFGHSHKDFFEVFYDDVTFERPSNILYVAGSVTAYPSLNPSYRIYEVDGLYDGSSFYPLDHHNYILNITEANISDNPVWEHEYSAKADLGLQNLYPREWDNLIFRLQINDTLFQQFYGYYRKLAPSKPCKLECKLKLLCDLMSGRSYDREHLCYELYK